MTIPTSNRELLPTDETVVLDQYVYNLQPDLSSNRVFTYYSGDGTEEVELIENDDYTYEYEAGSLSNSWV